MLDHWNAFRRDPQILALAEDYATKAPGGWIECDDVLWDWMRVEPDKLLGVICAVPQITADQRTWFYVAAGPLENLLGVQGEAVLERVKKLAHEHVEFREMVTGVWQGCMSKVLYQKVRSIGVGRL